jgi:hypothetical protein
LYPKFRSISKWSIKLQLKDAAFDILKQDRERLHYSEITDQALASGILATSGQTPHHHLPGCSEQPGRFGSIEILE